MLVIAYHSLEDRPVKERFRELTHTEDFHGDRRARRCGRRAAECAQSARAQRASALHRTERTMSPRVKPTRRPSKVMPTILGTLIAIVGFATLMVRLRGDAGRLSAFRAAR